MQTLTLSPSKSLLSPPHLYLLLLRHPFSSSSPLSTRRRLTDAEISSPRRLYRNHHDSDNSKAVKVSVWWDFENCSIPVGLNVYRVAPRIVSALRSNGIKGPVSINAFGDVVQLSRSTQDALISTGVSLTHVPHSGKNTSDRSFMADLINWTAQNPAPAHFFLISSDKDFATVLHRLRMNNYNIILSSNDYGSGALCSAATLMLPWGPLVRGEEFCAKYFNYAPDGLYGSWYGYFKGPLDDPFFGSEQIPYSQPDEIMKHINETKPRPIPKILINYILQIVNNNPNGIALSTIRDELKRRNILQKDLYGYKKFSNLINSLNNDLTLLPPPNGENQPYVYPKLKRVEPVDPFEKKPNVVEPVKENFKSETEDNKGVLGKEENKDILGIEENKGILRKEDNKGILGTAENKGILGTEDNKGILGKIRKILFGQEGEEKKR